MSDRSARPGNFTPATEEVKPARPPITIEPSRELQGTKPTTAEATQQTPVDVSVDELRRTVEHEIESYLAKPKLTTEEEKRLSEWSLRMALFCWDQDPSDHEQIVRNLEVAESHPFTARQYLSLAIEFQNPSLLERAEESLALNPVLELKTATCTDLLLTWLLRFRDAERAAALVESQTSSPDIAWSAFSLAEDWKTLVELSLDKKQTAEGYGLAKAQLAYDVFDDHETALTFLRTLKNEPSLALHTALLGTEVALGSKDPEKNSGEFWSSLLHAVEKSTDAGQEANGISFAGASAGFLGNATSVLLRLADAGSSAEWAKIAAGLLAWQKAAQKREWAVAAKALHSLLAHQGLSKSFTSAIRARLAQVFEFRLSDKKSALNLIRPLEKSSRDVVLDKQWERLLYHVEPQSLADHYEAVARHNPQSAGWLLKQAALSLVEPAPDREIKLLRQAFSHSSAGQFHDDLLRTVRKTGDRVRIADAYREVAGHLIKEKVGVSAAALFWAIGALELSQKGRERQAEEAFQQITKLVSNDIPAKVGLAAVYRRMARSKELAVLLDELIALCENTESKFNFLRELGELAATVLGDKKRAATAFEGALALRPNDPAILYALARLYEAQKDWKQAVGLRKRAIRESTDPNQGAMMWFEIAQIEESQLRDDEAALKSYQAAEVGSKAKLALGSMARILRKQRNPQALLPILEREAALTEAGEQALQLRMEIAQVTAQSGASFEAAFAAYKQVVDLDRKHEPALRAIEQLCSSKQKWRELAAVFEGAPPTIFSLQTLVKALTKLEEWRDLAIVMEKLFSLQSLPIEKKQTARTLAEIFEQRLNNVDASLKWQQTLLSLDSKDPIAHKQLEKTLERHGKHAELVGLLQTELASTPSGEVDKQILLMLQIADIYRGKLANPAEAAKHYEAVLAHRPRHAAALEALEGIYAQLSRNDDLLRVVENRAEVADKPTERSQFYRKTASLKEATGDVGGAIEAAHKAAQANPDDHEVFTEFESIGYRHKRWTAVLELYAATINRVETGASRAYRLSDLYARRAQVLNDYLKRPKEAAASLAKILEIEPENDHAFTTLTDLLQRTGEWTQLVEILERRSLLLGDPAKRVAGLSQAASLFITKLSRPDDAARVYTQLLVDDPKHKEALDFLERHYEKQGRWDLLIGVLRTRIDGVVGVRERVPLLLRCAQLAEEGLRDEQLAIDSYSQVIEAQPDHKKALDALSRIYESTERWADFVEVTKRQIRLVADRNSKALLYFKCGSVMEAKFGKEDEAIQHYDAAIKASPTCLPAVHGLRDIYLRRKAWPKVIQSLELEAKLWQDEKERAGVLAQIGRIFLDEIKDPQRAMRYFEDALQVDPDCVPANKAIFELSIEQQQWTRAVSLANGLSQKAMREGDPEIRADFFRKRGLALFHFGDAQSAAESLIVALEIRPTDTESLDLFLQIARNHPNSFDFLTSINELEKIYRKREDAGACLARILIARAELLIREGDLDAAQLLFHEAQKKAPTDMFIVLRQVELHENLRRFSAAAEEITRFIRANLNLEKSDVARLLIRQGELFADGELEPSKAIRCWTEAVTKDPESMQGHYLLAQGYYGQGKFAEAKNAALRLINLAEAAPDQDPEILAGYQFYLGRVLEAGGDAAAGRVAYEKAAAICPTFPPAVVALANFAFTSGEQAVAEQRLIAAAQTAIGERGERAAIPYQRALASILTQAGEKLAVIEAYRGMLAVDPDNVDDRLTLAEMYAKDDLPKAIVQTTEAVKRGIRYAPAYRQLASYCVRAGENTRAARAFMVMEELGFVDESDKRAAVGVLSQHAPGPLGRPLGPYRHDWLLQGLPSSPLSELWPYVADLVATLFPEPYCGNEIYPVQSLKLPRLLESMTYVSSVFETQVEVYVARDVPKGIVALHHPRPMIVIDREIVDGPVSAWQFALGFGLEAIWGRYGALLTMNSSQRSEVAGMLQSLFSPDSDKNPATKEWLSQMGPAAKQILNRIPTKAMNLNVEEALIQLTHGAKRAGLLMSDHFSHSATVIAKMAGENPKENRTPGLSVYGEDCILYYLSDTFHALRVEMAAKN